MNQLHLTTEQLLIVKSLLETRADELDYKLNGPRPPTSMENHNHLAHRLNEIYAILNKIDKL